MSTHPPIPLLVREVVARFRERLEPRFSDALLDIRLFGSYARGEGTDDSDVDVFVLLKTATFADRRDVLNIAGDLFRETDMLLSPTIMELRHYEQWREQERALVMDIEREGVSL